MSIESGNRIGPPEREPARAGFASERASMTSHSHPDRNDDAVIGDPDRFKREAMVPPSVETVQALDDQEMLQHGLERERSAAAALEKLGIIGAFDGISGEGKGAGALASRLAAVTVAERLATLSPSANAESSEAGIENAMRAANQAIFDYRQGRETKNDLDGMMTTGDVLRAVRAEDGSARVAYGHVGDGRIYHYVAAEKRLTCLTDDDNLARIEMSAGNITWEMYDAITMATDPVDFSMRLAKLPGGMKAYSQVQIDKMNQLYFDKNRLTNALGVSKDKLDLQTGVVDAKPGDRFYAFSDGVHGILNEQEMLAIIEAGGGIMEIVTAADKKRAASGVFDDVSGAEIVI